MDSPKAKGFIWNFDSSLHHVKLRIRAFYDGTVLFMTVPSPDDGSVHLDGSPVNLDGSPVNLDGSPVNLDGSYYANVKQYI